MSKLAVNHLELMLLIVESPEFYCIIVDSYKLRRLGVIKFNILTSLGGLGGGWLKTFTLAFLHTPHDDEISVNFAA